MTHKIHERELKELRYLFPVTRNWIYLNHAGVSPISRRVADAIMVFNQEALNEGYTCGPHWVKKIEKIRNSCAQLLGASADEIAFVKNTSHGLSLIAKGLTWKAGDEIILSEVEFPSNVYPWMSLEKHGVIIKKISSRNGELQLQELKTLISPKTRLISLSSVQYGTGYRLPTQEVGSLCRSRGILFCLDAIQSLGAFPHEVSLENIDFLTADAHKWMLGHEGIGLLYVRRALLEKIEPVLLGWNSVEQALNFDQIDFKLRSSAQKFEEGSHNGLSIYGLGAAVDLLLEVGVSRISERILKLTENLIQGLQHQGMILHNPLRTEYRSGIILCSLPEDKDGIRLQALERHLFSKNIYVTIRRGALRFSPHFYNSEAEIEDALKEIELYLRQE